MAVNILNDVSEYYSSKLAKHGETPRGVDRNGEVSQTLRFEQLSKIIEQFEFVFNHKCQHMQYNGNGYGKTGFGLAVLEG